MKYLYVLRKLKDCNSIYCECIADTLKKEYLYNEVIRKYIKLCEIMAVRNKKDYGEDVSIIPDDEIYRVVEYYTGIKEDQLIKNNIKKIDVHKYFSRFSYLELGRIISLCRDYISKEYYDEIVEACNYIRMTKELLMLDFDTEPVIFDDGYLIEQVNNYVENNEKKKKILNII